MHEILKWCTPRLKDMAHHGALSSVVGDSAQAAVTIRQAAKDRESQESMTCRSQQMAAYSEKTLDDTVEKEEPQGLSGRFESPHLPLPLAGGPMRS